LDSPSAATARRVHCGGKHLKVMDAAPTGEDMLDGFSF
jgi:hypothetical protein